MIHFLEFLNQLMTISDTVTCLVLLFSCSLQVRVFLEKLTSTNNVVHVQYELLVLYWFIICDLICKKGHILAEF